MGNPQLGAENFRDLSLGKSAHAQNPKGRRFQKILHSFYAKKRSLANPATMFRL